MGLIQFVQNYQDLSTDRGYQFKFHCDKCGNGFMTTYRPSVIGTAGSLLRAAGSILGGWASSAGHSAYEVQRAVGGQAHDEALREAVEEARPHFHQCPRCGRWVCHHPCWNGQASLCTGCAPEFQTELAAAHADAKAQAARHQLYDKAARTDYAGGVSMAPNAVVAAPFAPPPAAAAGPPPAAFPPAPAAAAGPPPAFAPAPPAREPHHARGLPPPAPVAPSAAEAARCSGCGHATGGAKFCPECGTPARPPVNACPSCGHRPERVTKFCAECGAKMG
jgi:hypothetical protein